MTHTISFQSRLATLLLSFAFTATSPANETPSDIVVIMADDMGYSDIGCMGSEVRTSHLDSLAENGLLFTRFHNSMRCVPTRASPPWQPCGKPGRNAVS